MKPREFALVLSFTALAAMPGSPRAQQVTEVPLCNTTDRVARFWVRTNSSADVQVRLFGDPAFQNQLYATNTVTTSGASDFTAVVETPAYPGLGANTKFYYRVHLNDQPTTSTGEFTTFPVSTSTQDFSFVMLCDLQDSDESNVFADAYAGAAFTNPTFAMLVGDFDHRTPSTLSGRRMMYRDMRSPTLLAGATFAAQIAPKYPVFYMWDNHDFGSGDKYFTSGNCPPPVNCVPSNCTDDFQKRCEAWQSFREFWPNPPAASPPPSNCLGLESE